MLNHPDNKVILFTPQHMLIGEGLFQSMHILKTKQSIRFENSVLDREELRTSFHHLPGMLKELLVEFDKEHTIKLGNSIIAKYKAGMAGVDYEQFFENAWLREIYEKFERLKPFVSLVKWYHSTWKNKRNIKTAPCLFSNYRPLLQFKVIKENAHLILHTLISLNGSTYLLEDFKRFHFYLESNNEYFLLRFKDYQLLEWLQNQNPLLYSQDPQGLALNILARLEEEYEVDRNGLFNQKIIESLPLKRIMLTEISSSFLVLTPQWVYDGFVVEGNWEPTYEKTAGGEQFIVKRNKETEQQFINDIVALHPNFIKQLNGYYYLPFAEAQKKQWFLKAYHYLLDQDIEIAGMDMLKHFRYSPYKAATRSSVLQNENNRLKLELTIYFGKEKVGLGELQKVLLAGQKAVLLKDGSLGILGDEWIQQYGTLVKHGKITKREIEVPVWMALTEEKLSDEMQVLKPVINKEWWNKWEKWQREPAELFTVPEGIAGTLRPYQHKGFEWMCLLAEAGAGSCLADDMGLGKTLQAICFIAHRLQAATNAKCLIVSPASLMYNWSQELQKFAPALGTLIYHGSQRKFENIGLPEYQVVITSYGTLRSDMEKIRDIYFDVVVIDESHNIKNPAALITRSLQQLSAGIRIALSGTPVMNNTFDLYAQLNFVLPGMFGSREFFKREYADAIDRDHDAEKIAALHKLTMPFILRRTKEQVAPDLPEKIESILWCEMGATQREIYESVKETVRVSIFLDIKEKGLAGGKLNVINGMLKLRQICNSPLLVKSDNEMMPVDSVKTDILVEELQNIIAGHKALVFSQFTGMLDLLEKDLNKNNILFIRLDGNTPVKERQELVNRFQQEESKEKVFLISLKAGNAGLNLTAADYVFLFDPWWNTAVQQQAIDRTHRIGQDKTVMAYKMICKDTIEEKIILLQQRKKKLAENLVQEEEGFVKSLSEKDVDFLFS